VIERRTLLKAGLGAGLGLSLTSRDGLKAVPYTEPVGNALQGVPDGSGPQIGDLLVRIGDANQYPLSPGEIKRGAKPVIAWAMDPANEALRDGSPLHQVLLVRLDPLTLESETRSRAADGVLAYNAICTHADCKVDDWLAAEQVLHCACHGSKFDPKDSAKVVGGEASRPLAALPLKLDDGQLVVAGPFTARVGF
jgi:rieske iron-sulfur protein